MDGQGEASDKATSLSEVSGLQKLALLGGAERQVPQIIRAPGNELEPVFCGKTCTQCRIAKVITRSRKGSIGA